jgi:restriction system protein
MITGNEPESWQALQREVGRILSECGFVVEIEKIAECARGKVELDVYAAENVRGRKYVIACECKYWGTRIPQAVVHGFRTVVQETGANVGYIISMQGFQSGAVVASDFTNLKLVTWQEFQDIFQESWLEEYFTKQIDEKLDPLLTYTEPLLPAWFDRMTEEDKKAYFALKEKYDLFGMLMQSLSSYGRIARKKALPMLPLRALFEAAPILDTIPNHILDETAYRELLDSSVAYGEVATSEFRGLRDKYVM